MLLNQSRNMLAFVQLYSMILCYYIKIYHLFNKI